MTRPCCYHRHRASPATASSPPTPMPTLARRGLGLAAWAAPAAGLLLMPKCPACVAAYITLATGVGITISAAAWLRSTLLVICAVILACLAVRQGYRLIVRGRFGAPVRGIAS